ncbi:MAG: FAD-dependent oxidoreductase [Caulobacteraceae bacterium]
MSSLRDARIAVAGGGAFGLMTALALARRGAEVRVYDPQPSGRSASSIAAGMLGVAFEALESGWDATLFALLCAGLDAWTTETRFPVDRSGAVYASFGGGEDLARVAAGLDALGTPYEALTGDAARVLQPALSAHVTAALRVPVEGRVDPSRCLPAMARALGELGGRILAEEVPSGASFDRWRRGRADAVVIAAGHASVGWVDHASVLGRLRPIKGHILHFDGGPRNGPVVRNGEDYVAPQPGGAVFGATMQPDQADLALEPDQVEGLRLRAIEIIPELAGLPFSAHAGVRAATADGLPLAGALGGGLFAATGARRNGWLLAPLVAETVAAAIAGEAAPYASAFDPFRFG